VKKVLKNLIIALMTIKASAILIVILSAGSAMAQSGPKNDDYRISEVNVPYGNYHSMQENGVYGDKLQIKTAQEAVEIVKGFYAKKKISTSRVVERQWFFMLDVLDESRNIIDVVIVDKRNGRMRSVY
jgi:hypothetical protein